MKRRESIGAETVSAELSQNVFFILVLPEFLYHLNVYVDEAALLFQPFKNVFYFNLTHLSCYKAQHLLKPL